MKFYLAIDGNGRKQLRTTKADIEKVSKTYDQIDIPVDQASVQHMVQESFDRIFDLEQQLQAVPEPYADPAPAAPQPAPVRNLSSSYEATDIEDFILNRAEIFHVENIFATLGTRMSELIKKDQLNVQDPNTIE